MDDHNTPSCRYCKGFDAEPVTGLCPSCIARFSEPPVPEIYPEADQNLLRNAN